MLAERGAVIIDADKVAHETYRAGSEGFARLVERFGDEIITDDGEIDRAKLGKKVFSDLSALGDLNAIIHPLVQREVAERVRRVRREHPESTPVVEAALMTETRWTGGAGALWVVVAEPETAVARLRRDRGMTEEEARARIASQATNAERARHADVLLENDGTRADLEAAVERAWCQHLRVS